MSFVTSPFGSLATTVFATDSPTTTTKKIPRLRFEHGDLVIKLDREPSSWLIIHSKVFAAVSPVFRVSTSGAWKETAQLDTIKHPRTGEEVEVRTLALKRIDDTYILEGKDVSLQTNDASTIRAVPFHQSSLATEDWPSLTGHNSPLATGEQDTTLPPTESAQALHVFFALVYGAQLTLQQIAGEKRITNRFLDVCAYADYYGCFETLKPALAKVLRLEATGGSKKPIWRAVARDPLVYAFVARIFRFLPIYNDALRHLVASAYLADLVEPRSGDWATIAELMDLEEEEVLNLFPWQLEWTGEPDALPPNDKMKLEGKGWDEVGRPVAAQFCDSVYFGRYTCLAMPVRRVPWKKGRRARVVEWETVDMKEVGKGVRVEEGSEEWVGEAARVLGE